MNTNLKRIIFLPFVICLLLFSCNETSIIEPQPDIKGDCSAISETITDSMARKLLGTLHPVKYPLSASLKGTYLLYSDFTSENVYLVNTKTGQRKYIDFQSMLPSNLKFEYFNNAVFCPYDENLFMVCISVTTDSNGNNQNVKTINHIFVYDVVQNILKLVTPAFVSNLGNNFGLQTWVETSSLNNNNVFLIPFGIVNLESNNVVKSVYINKLLKVSPNGEDYISSERTYYSEGLETIQYKLNNIILDFDTNFWTGIPEGLHFSQNGKFILFTTKVIQIKPFVIDLYYPEARPPKDTMPYSQKRFLETFIVDVEKTKYSGKMVLHNIIRFRRDLCLTGVFWNAQFLTPSSFVISYRYNNTELHQLHEISIDGKILGQVTM